MPVRRRRRAARVFRAQALTDVVVKAEPLRDGRFSRNSRAVTSSQQYAEAKATRNSTRLLVTGHRAGVPGNLPSLNGSRLYDDISERLGAENDGQRAAAVELALEGLYPRPADRQGVDVNEATVYG